MTDFGMKLLKAECEGNQQEREEFRCYKIWQMMTSGFVARKWAAETERDGDTEKGCQKHAV